MSASKKLPVLSIQDQMMVDFIVRKSLESHYEAEQEAAEQAVVAIALALVDLAERATAVGDHATRYRTVQVMQRWVDGTESAEYAKAWARDTVVRETKAP